MADRPQPQDQHDRPTDRRSTPSPSAGGARGNDDGNREATPARGRDVEHVREAIHRTYK
jgi:hypothetical protein